MVTAPTLYTPSTLCIIWWRVSPAARLGGRHCGLLASWMLIADYTGTDPARLLRQNGTYRSFPVHPSIHPCLPYSWMENSILCASGGIMREKYHVYTHPTLIIRVVMFLILSGSVLFFVEYLWGCFNQCTSHRLWFYRQHGLWLYLYLWWTMPFFLLCKTIPSLRN